MKNCPFCGNTHTSDESVEKCISNFLAEESKPLVVSKHRHLTDPDHIFDSNVLKQDHISLALSLPNEENYKVNYVRF